MANLKFKLTKDGYYDIFAENGKLKITEGLDTQLLASILVNQRINDDENSEKQLQGGWLGNIIISDDLKYEIGCKQWFFTKQGKLTPQSISSIIDTIKKDGLDWFIKNNLADEIKVFVDEVNYASGKLILTIQVINDNNIIENNKVELWQKTIL